MALSNTDARAIKAIIVLGSMVEEGHFGIYKKDSQICRIGSIEKVYGLRPRTEIEIEEINEN